MLSCFTLHSDLNHLLLCIKKIIVPGKLNTLHPVGDPMRGSPTRTKETQEEESFYENHFLHIRELFSLQLVEINTTRQ